MLSNLYFLIKHGRHNNPINVVASVFFYGCTASCVEHRSYSCQEPCRGHAVVAYQRHEPSDFEEASSKVLALGIEMTLVYSVALAEPRDALHAIVFLDGIESHVEPGHYPDCRFTVNAAAAHCSAFSFFGVLLSR